jgi:SAM-dependent methyltransferase
VLIKLLRYSSTVLQRFIALLDKDKSVFDNGSYRVELKYFIEKYLAFIEGRILDIGAGSWVWIKERLSQKPGCKVVSFDKFSTPNIDVVGDLYELQKYFASNEFDVVVCTEVIEHVPRPQDAINKIAEVLKPGGLLLLSCPFDKDLHGEDYGDFWRITRQGWQELLKQNFIDIVITYVGPELKPKGYFIKAVKK